MTRKVGQGVWYGWWDGMIRYPGGGVVKSE